MWLKDQLRITQGDVIMDMQTIEQNETEIITKKLKGLLRIKGFRLTKFELTCFKQGVHCGSEINSELHKGK